MDSLLEVLFKNNQVLFIVIAGVVSLLWRMLKSGALGSKPGQPRTAKPIQPMPTFGGGPGDRKAAKPSPLGREADRRETERRELEQMAKRQQEEWDAARRLAAEEDLLRQEQRRREAEEQRSLRTSEAKPEAQRSSAGKSAGSGLPRQGGAIAAAAKDSTPAPGLEAPTRDDLAQAVVWAEILGPPRSKRPYGRR